MSNPSEISHRPSLTFRLAAAARSGLQRHGLKFPFVVVHRASVSFYRRRFGPKHFEFAGRQHEYLIHPFILDNERAVEVAIIREFLRGKQGKILEVGNVLSNFLSIPHEVLDKYEVAPGVVNEDIVSFSPGKQYDVIVTISTLEHVGWDEQPREPQKILRAIARLKELLAPGGKLAATMPIGYNSFLDELIRTRQLPFSELRYLVRFSADNQWREASFEEAVSARFGAPYSCANAIVVGYVGPT